MQWTGRPRGIDECVLKVLLDVVDALLYRIKDRDLIRKLHHMPRKAPHDRKILLAQCASDIGREQLDLLIERLIAGHAQVFVCVTFDAVVSHRFIQRVHLGRVGVRERVRDQVGRLSAMTHVIDESLERLRG